MNVMKIGNKYDTIHEQWMDVMIYNRNSGGQKYVHNTNKNALACI